MSNLLKIDGSLGEGGGQVLRVALCLSALYRIPVEIDNIRAGRPKPGLAAQHLKGVELVKELCNARVLGAHIGSTRLEFHPGPLEGRRREYVADTKTAGCIGLLAQVGLPCALFAPSSEPITLILKGGTNVPMGPHIEYLTEVFKPILNKFGADFDFSVIKRGYYPAGGGEFHLRIKPVKHLNAVDLTNPGIPSQITGWSYVAGVVPINEAHKMANDAKNVLKQGLSNHDIAVPPIDILAYKEERDTAVGNGSGINVVCTTNTGCIFGGSGLRSKRDQTVPGIEAANQILTPLLSNSCVDEHSQDQLVILMALAKGTSRVSIGTKELTCHTETAIKVAEIMLGDRGLRFNLSKSSGGDLAPHILECEGIGLFNEFLK
ncbi:RNA 3'-terminal phosphate cyclase isoform X2 [Belonocnema kinseyi]|uniref:RNA 3'-terminal phosphate cyclase isoform X2 n=1 Tax=Belonocnema kinseyi TaxID=2817044 RepID=UPI00143D15B3|nr:RNA 3'-terminal phosphate cyclase isoform X2 [Belonocnema kinseyi]